MSACPPKTPLRTPPWSASLLRVALACCHPVRHLRPTARQIAAALRVVLREDTVHGEFDAMTELGIARPVERESDSAEWERRRQDRMRIELDTRRRLQVSRPNHSVDEIARILRPPETVGVVTRERPTVGRRDEAHPHAPPPRSRGAHRSTMGPASHAREHPHDDEEQTAAAASPEVGEEAWEEVVDKRRGHIGAGHGGSGARGRGARPATDRGTSPYVSDASSRGRGERFRQGAFRGTQGQRGGGGWRGGPRPRAEGPPMSWRE
jgi:hypothetical protein